MTLKVDERGVLVSCPACQARNRLPFRNLAARTRCGQCKAELPPVNQPVVLATAQQFRAATQESSIPILVDFWAAWCGPCKMLAPELEKVAPTAAGEVLIAKVNTEEVPEVAAQYQISSIPNLVLMKDGREVSRLAGARPAKDIVAFLRSAR